MNRWSEYNPSCQLFSAIFETRTILYTLLPISILKSRASSTKLTFMENRTIRHLPQRKNNYCISRSSHKTILRNTSLKMKATGLDSQKSPIKRWRGNNVVLLLWLLLLFFVFCLLFVVCCLLCQRYKSEQYLIKTSQRVMDQDVGVAVRKENTNRFVNWYLFG